MELIGVISETESRPSVPPTHANRNEKLFQKAIEYAVKGGAVDFTGMKRSITGKLSVMKSACKGIRRMLDGREPEHHHHPTVKVVCRS